MASIFLKIPFESNGMGLSGKNYIATKDFLTWGGYDPEIWTSVMLRMGNVWINSIKKE